MIAIFYLLSFVILFQDMIGIIMFNADLSPMIVKAFLSFKDIILMGMILLNLMSIGILRRYLKINAAIVIFCIYTSVVLSYFFFVDNPGKNWNDLRSLLFPFYAYLAGYTSYYYNRERLIKNIGIVTLFAVLVSLAVYSMGSSFMLKMRVLEYTECVRGYYGLVFEGLPSTFFGAFSKIKVFRLAGSVLNPIGTATIFIFCFSALYSYYRHEKVRIYVKITLALLISAIFLTFSRGPIFGLLVGLPIANLVWSRKAKSANSLLIGFIVIGVCVALYEIFFTIIRDTVLVADPSTMGHVNALKDAGKYIFNYWIGDGVGSGGQWSSTGLQVGENSFIMIAVQVGLIPLILMALIYFINIRGFLKNKKYILNYGLLIFTIAYLFIAVFSPALLTVTPGVLYWFFVGYSQGQIKMLEYKA